MEATETSNGRYLAEGVADFRSASRCLFVYSCSGSFAISSRLLSSFLAEGAVAVGKIVAHDVVDMSGESYY